jgi:hypothetical protein
MVDINTKFLGPPREFLRSWPHGVLFTTHVVLQVHRRERTVAMVRLANVRRAPAHAMHVPLRCAAQVKPLPLPEPKKRLSLR